MASSHRPSATHPVQHTISEKDIYEKPWRYIGYRGFSEWLASSDHFFVVRRFDALSARVILLLQWELSKLETRLSQLDFARSHVADNDLDNGSYEADDDERRKLIRKIQENLSEYYTFINKYAELRSRPGASYNNKENILRWLANRNSPINKNEVSFVQHEDDLFAIAPTFRTPLRGALEKFVWFRSRSIFRRFFRRLFKRILRLSSDSTENQAVPGSHAPEATIKEADKLVDVFVDATITSVAGFAMLAMPLWILFYVPTRLSQLVVITVFIAVFLGIIQWLSIARPFECLVATAAYSAVLMVYMQTGPLGSHGSE